jgi:hypothetical protein
MPPKPLFAAPRAHPYGDMDVPSMGSGARQWGLKGGTGLTLLAFVVLYGSIVLLQKNEQSASQVQVGSSSIAQGSVMANQPHTGAHAAVPAAIAHSHSPSNASVASEHKTDPQPVPQRNPSAPIIATAPPPAAVASPASPSPSPSPPASTSSSQQPAVAYVTPSPEAQPMAAPAPPPTSQSHPMDASVHAPTLPAQPLGTRASPSHSWNGRATLSPLDYLNARGPAPTVRVPEAQQQVIRHDRSRDGASSASLAGARAALDKNDLAAARAALASQPNTGEAYMLRQDVASREKSRDALLNTARACVVQQRWSCAWHNAGDALSIDSSSVEAKALIERSIVDSGAASTPPGPGPGPDVPAVQ